MTQDEAQALRESIDSEINGFVSMYEAVRLGIEPFRWLEIDLFAAYTARLQAFEQMFMPLRDEYAGIVAESPVIIEKMQRLKVKLDPVYTSMLSFNGKIMPVIEDPKKLRDLAPTDKMDELMSLAKFVTIGAVFFVSAKYVLPLVLKK